jgi:hypothetical protein
MQQENARHQAAVDPSGDSAPRSKRGVAKVLERAIALDLVPPTVKLGAREIDTATYIAECADIARHRGSRSTTDTAYPWLMPQDMPQET